MRSQLAFAEYWLFWSPFVLSCFYINKLVGYTIKQSWHVFKTYTISNTTHSQNKYLFIQFSSCNFKFHSSVVCYFFSTYLRKQETSFRLEISLNSNHMDTSIKATHCNGSFSSRPLVLLDQRPCYFPWGHNLTRKSKVTKKERHRTIITSNYRTQIQTETCVMCILEMPVTCPKVHSSSPRKSASCKLQVSLSMSYNSNLSFCTISK